MLHPHRISPWQLLEYLRYKNWILGPASGDARSLYNGRFWRNKSPNETAHPTVIITPHTRDYSNYRNAIMQALETLSKEEGRSLHEIADDIMKISTDQSPKIVQSLQGVQFWWHPSEQRYYNEEQFLHPDIMLAAEDEGVEEWEVLEE